MIAEVVLAELTGGVTEIEQELCQARRAGSQVRRTARELRRDHAGAHRIHAGDEGVPPRRAARLGVVGHESSAFSRKAIDVWSFTHHQALVIATRLHPADVVAHDEQYVWLLATLLGQGGLVAGPANYQYANRDHCFWQQTKFMETHVSTPRFWTYV